MESSKPRPGALDSGQPRGIRKSSGGPAGKQISPIYQILISHEKSDGTVKQKILNVGLVNLDGNPQSQVEIILQKDL
jgi:hypothetical protein